MALTWKWPRKLSSTIGLSRAVPVPAANTDCRGQDLFLWGERKVAHRIGPITEAPNPSGSPRRMNALRGRFVPACRMPTGFPEIGDRGCDAIWLGEARQDKGMRPHRPAGRRRCRKVPVPHDKRRCKRRHRIDCMFGGLEDWRRIVTRCDRRPKVFLSAIASDATVIHWPWDAVTGRTQLERCHLPDSARVLRAQLPCPVSNSRGG